MANITIKSEKVTNSLGMEFEDITSDLSGGI